MTKIKKVYAKEISRDVATFAERSWDILEFLRDRDYLNLRGKILCEKYWQKFVCREREEK